MAVAAVGRASCSIHAPEAAAEAVFPASVRARVVTTQAGLTLGRFGISYTSRNVEFLSDERGSSAPASGASVMGSGTVSRAESFAAVLEAASLSQGMGDVVNALPPTDADARPTATRPYAAAAYAAVSRAARTAYTPRTLLATV